MHAICKNAVVADFLAVVSEQAVLCVIGHGGAGERTDAFFRIRGLGAAYGDDVSALVIGVAVGGKDLFAAGVVLGEEQARVIVGTGFLCAIGALRTGEVSSGVIAVPGYFSGGVGDGLKPAVLIIRASHNLSAGIGQIDQVADLVISVPDGVASGVGVFGDSVQDIPYHTSAFHAVIENQVWL